MNRSNYSICIVRSSVSKIPGIDAKTLAVWKGRFTKNKYYTANWHDDEWCWFPDVIKKVERADGLDWQTIVEQHLQDVRPLCTPAETDAYSSRAGNKILLAALKMAWDRFGHTPELLTLDELKYSLEIRYVYGGGYWSGGQSKVRLNSYERLWAPAQGKFEPLDNILIAAIAGRWVEDYMGDVHRYSVASFIEHKFKGQKIVHDLNEMHETRFYNHVPALPYAGNCPFCPTCPIVYHAYDIPDHVRDKHPEHYFDRTWFHRYFGSARPQEISFQQLRHAQPGASSLDLQSAH